MRCGEPAAEHVRLHMCPHPKLDGRPVRKGQWAMRCPACCSENRKLTLTLEGEKFLWKCHRGCSQDQVWQALVGLLPGCFAPPRRKRKTGPTPPDPEALLVLIRRDLPATALKIGVARALGLSAEKARAELGVAKSTYYDALRELGR